MNADEVLNALGDPTRREIVAVLARGPRTVGELAAELPVTRSAVSQHLRVLSEARLVDCTAAGTRRYYRLTSEGLTDVQAYLDTLWRLTMADLKRVAEREVDE